MVVHVHVQVHDVVHLLLRVAASVAPVPANKTSLSSALKETPHSFWQHGGARPAVLATGVPAPVPARRGRALRVPVRRAMRAVGVREVRGRSVGVPVSRPVVGSVLVVRGPPEAPRLAVNAVAGVPVGSLVVGAVGRAVQRALGVVDGDAQVHCLQCVAGRAVAVAVVAVMAVAVAVARPRAVAGAVVVAPAPVAAPGVAVRAGGGAAGRGAAAWRSGAGHIVS